MAIVLHADTRVVVVPIAIDAYVKPTADDPATSTQFDPLPRIKDDLSALRTLFESQPYRAAGFQMLDTIREETAGKIIDRLKEVKKAVAAKSPAAAILFWTGHGRAVQNELRLITAECVDPIDGSDGLEPAEVIGQLADAKVNTLFVLLDVCQAAAASAQLITAAAKRSFERSPDKPFALSALFSAYPFENAQDGFFVESLVRLMQRGPSTEAITLAQKTHWGEAFNINNSLLSLKEIEDALYFEVDVAKRKRPSLPTPDAVHSGRSLRVFPNPWFKANAPAVNVEEARKRRQLEADVDTHFLPKARGLEPTEEGWFFSGRRAVAREIVQWLDHVGPASSERLFVLTGDGGTGKSAVVGRLVILSDESYRATARGMGWDQVVDESEGTVPRSGAIDAALHLRNLTAQQATRSLAELLEVKTSPSADVATVVASVPVLRPDSRQPVTFVLDALDESNEPGTIAETVIRPLIEKGCRILVATRGSAADRGVDDLIEALGPAHVHSLNHEPSTEEDIAGYVRRRLLRTSGSPYADSPDVATAVSSALAQRAGGKFLYTRIMTAELLRRHQPINMADVERELALNLDDALLRESATLDTAFRQRFQRDDAGSSALLAALAWSEGSGLPLRDELWPKVATAISEATAPLTQEHVLWLLREGGRFIVEDGDGEQAVYRLYHQSLNEHFRTRVNYQAVILRLPAILEAEVETSGGWMYVNPYIIRHLAAHVALQEDEKSLEQLLLNFSWMSAKLRRLGIQALLSDYRLRRLTQGPVPRLERVLGQSAHILTVDPLQLATQLLARLQSAPETARLLEAARADAPRPWLRPLTASLAGEQSTRWLRPIEAETLSSVAISSNGLWAAHVSGSNAVMLWDLKQWQARGSIFRVKDHSYALALSEDGKWCLFSDSGGGVYRWSAATGEMRGCQVHKAIPSMLGISTGGRYALSATQWPELGLIAWDFESDRHEVVWDDGNDQITALSLNRRGDSAAVARADGTVHVMDLWPVRSRGRFNVGGRVLGLARSTDDSMLVSIDTAGSIELRRVDALETPVIVLSTEEQPRSVALSPDQGYIAVGTERGTVEIWNTKHKVRSALYGHAHTHEVERIAFSHDGNHVISADTLQIKEWDVEGGGHVSAPSILRTASDVKVSNDGKHGIAILDDGRLGVWDLYTGELQATVKGSAPPGRSKGITLAASAPRVLTWNDDHLFVWDFEQATQVASLKVGKIEDAGFSPDGRAVVYAVGTAVSLWHPDDNRNDALGNDRDEIRHVAISPDGQQALTSGFDRALTLWRPNRPASDGVSVLDRYRPDSRDKPSLMAFCEPRAAIVTTGDGSVFVLDTQEDEIAAARLPGSHDSSIRRILSAPSGLLVTSSYQKIIVWNYKRRRRLAVFSTHQGHVQQMSNAASRLLLLSLDGILKLISLKDGTLITAFQGDKQIVSCAADKDLRWIAAADEGGQIHFLHVEDIID